MVERVLVPVDFSPASLKALEYATALCAPFGAALLVLNVVEPLYHTEDFGVLYEESHRRARQQLAQLDRRLKRRGLKCRTLLGSGPPHQVIVDTARKLKADLIVMSTHGRTGLSKLFIGSIADKVVRTAACPVLTLRPRAARRRSRR